jgi:hypothetical protein
MAAGGDEGLSRALLGAVLRFRRLCGSRLIDAPAPGYAAIARVYRGLAALAADGTVATADLFHIRRLDAFLADPGERSAALSEAAWDNRATLFASRQPPRRTRDVRSLLDYGGQSLGLAMPDLIRHAEFMINRDLHGHPLAARVLAPEPGGSGAHTPLRQEARLGFAAVLGPLAADEARSVLQAFRARLDPARLRALGAAGANSVAAYNWLGGNDGLGSGSELGRRRTQAVTAYPLAWPAIAAPCGSVAEAVGQAKPLAPVLAASLGISEADLRRMNGLGIDGAGLAAAPDLGGMASLARKVSRMPPGRLPGTDRGWRAFFFSAALADAVQALLGDDSGACAARLLASAAGAWDSMDPDMIGQAAGGAADMAADFHANVAEPAAALSGVRGWTARKTFAAVAGGRSLVQIAQASAWWHNSQAGIRARLAGAHPLPNGQVDTASWPPLHGGGHWTAANGLLLVPLVTEAMLVDEHQRMGHCVNRYAPMCLFNGAHILSVRSPGGVSLATAEFSQAGVLAAAGTLAEPPDAPLIQLPPCVSQFKARHNGVPDPAAWEALWDYAGAIMTGTLKVDGKALQDALADRQKTGRHGRRVATCYDASTADAVRSAWQCYAPMLPRSKAKRGPASLFGSACGPLAGQAAEPV